MSAHGIKPLQIILLIEFSALPNIDENSSRVMFQEYLVSESLFAPVRGSVRAGGLFINIILIGYGNERSLTNLDIVLI